MRALTSYVKLGKNKHDDAPDCLTLLGNFAKVYSFPKKTETRKPLWDFESEEKGDFIDW
jgi:hypothetical protein